MKYIYILGSKLNLNLFPRLQQLIVLYIFAVIAIKHNACVCQLLSVILCVFYIKQEYLYLVALFLRTLAVYFVKDIVEFSH